MAKRSAEYFVEHYFLADDGNFPNSALPVLFYKNVLDLPRFFASRYVKRLFKKHNWSNSWVYGVFEYHHYHSITHEVMGVIEGRTKILLGGPRGLTLTIEKGDVLIIPAGVAHKNLGKESAVKCVGAYPSGMDYDINYGNAGERPTADKNIRLVPIPRQDPVFGGRGGLSLYW